MVRGHSKTTWTIRGGWVVSQMSTVVHVGWVGGQWNVHVDILSCPLHSTYHYLNYNRIYSFPNESKPSFGKYMLHKNEISFMPTFVWAKWGAYCIGRIRGWSFSRCPRGQGVGGKPNVHACPLGVGGWSKKVKILSTWFLNAPHAHLENFICLFLLQIISG